tara:strand:+ start:846 stop:1892 length:1047 start_codon:yes stop_codon:yes gene_type:complete
MAITRASDLAAVGSGLGANPAQPINIGAAVTISGSAGVITATTFSGNATGLGGEPSIVVDSVRASDESTFLGGLKVTGVTTSSQGFSGNITGTAATFSGNVIVGGVLTYEDVTNIDSIGIITARSDVSIADKIIHTGDTNTAIRFPQSDTFTVETAGSERLRIGPTGISTFTGNISLTAGGAERLNLAHVSGGDVLIKNPTDAYLAFGTNNTERLRITNTGIALFKAGLAEKVNVKTQLTGANDCAITDGNVILTTGNEPGNTYPNITGVHSVLSSGEGFSVTIALKVNGSGTINGFYIDGQTQTIEWSGGSAPSAGSSGYDVFTFSAFKTGTGATDYVVLGSATNHD